MDCSERIGPGGLGWEGIDCVAASEEAASEEVASERMFCSCALLLLRAHRRLSLHCCAGRDAMLLPTKMECCSAERNIWSTTDKASGLEFSFYMWSLAGALLVVSDANAMRIPFRVLHATNSTHLIRDGHEIDASGRDLALSALNSSQATGCKHDSHST